jgi:hypothetical protein
VLLGVATLAALLHAGNLLHLARSYGCNLPRLGCLEAVGRSATPDTRSYLEVAAQIRERGLLGASYRRRPPGYPLLLGLSQRLTGSHSAVLWLAPPLAGVAAAAIAWLAALLAGRARAGLAAGLLFCAWPNAYQFAPLLMTDALHAFLAVAALAATLAGRERERVAAAGIAAALWAVVQSLRPTFFPLALALPLLLAKRRAGRRTRRLSLALWGATLLVPALVLASSLATPGATGLPNTCYLVPRLQQELGLGQFDRLRAQCRRRYHRDPWRQTRRDLEFLRAHQGDALASLGRELGTQMWFPHRPYYFRELAPLYPAWSAMRPRSAAAFWLCAAAGLLLVARRRPGLAGFLLLALALVMGPSLLTTRVGARIRFPLDLFALPLVAVLAERILARAIRLLRRWRGAGPRP